MEDLSTLKELGIAGVAVGGLLYVVFRLIKELGENRKDYCNFVNANNQVEAIKRKIALLQAR